MYGSLKSCMSKEKTEDADSSVCLLPRGLPGGGRVDGSTSWPAGSHSGLSVISLKSRGKYGLAPAAVAAVETSRMRRMG
jgi:hypothetical protein